ncbi:hypothetical protein FE152_09875 [Streptococcus pneumoniae]|nr:hypothetical protein FE152_09875 [Streptococcus pneumoniae]HEX1975672.1 hypothetical protein [Streptococcus pneumoniae]
MDHFKDYPKFLKYADLNSKQNQSRNSHSQQTDLVKRGNVISVYYLVEITNSVR